jgi:hypothetical protein
LTIYHTPIAVPLRIKMNDVPLTFEKDFISAFLRFSELQDFGLSRVGLEQRDEARLSSNTTTDEHWKPFLIVFPDPRGHGGKDLRPRLP